MAKVIERTGKTIQEAIQVAAEELGVNESELEIEVLETPSKKIFGLFGGAPAKIRATLKEVEPPKIEIAPPIKIVEVSEPAQIAKEEIPAEKFEPVLEPSPVEEETSEPELVDRAKLIDAAEKFLQDVFAAMKLEVTIEAEDSEENCLLNLSGKGLGVLIGKHGQALDSLQYLLNLAVNRKLTDDRVYFVLDVEDYRRRREETLIKLAKGVAERAIKTRKDVRLEPMSRHERKIIHTVLQENKRVETHSVGEEPYRYVVVTPVKRGRR